ncbi:MAG: hypothetical protein R3B90_15365 [Planctomycetaceae bacterium]
MFGLAAIWAVLAVQHGVAAIHDRARDWAYFGTRSGDEVLPNISFENRDVIRYVRESTPKDARIFVYSDQKLFFLSYYLLPRRLHHRMHPEAEFVIPRPGQERPLPAWQPGDLTPAVVTASDPDYILQYFEGPDFVDESQLGGDPQWVAFWRSRQQQRTLPPYRVALTPTISATPVTSQSAAATEAAP